MMNRHSGGGGGFAPGGGSSKGAAGILSFIGIVWITLTALGSVKHSGQGVFLSCLVAGVVFVVSLWAAYRARGVVGVLAGVGLTGVAAYSAYVVMSGEGGGWGWPIAFLVLVGIDQIALKSQ
jgi:hypothetical protein